MKYFTVVSLAVFWFAAASPVLAQCGPGMVSWNPGGKAEPCLDRSEPEAEVPRRALVRSTPPAATPSRQQEQQTATTIREAPSLADTPRLESVVETLGFLEGKGVAFQVKPCGEQESDRFQSYLYWHYYQYRYMGVYQGPLYSASKLVSSLSQGIRLNLEHSLSRNTRVRLVPVSQAEYLIDACWQTTEETVQSRSWLAVSFTQGRKVKALLQGRLIDRSSRVLFVFRGTGENRVKEYSVTDFIVGVSESTSFPNPSGLAQKLVDEMLEDVRDSTLELRAALQQASDAKAALREVKEAEKAKRQMAWACAELEKHGRSCR